MAYTEVTNQGWFSRLADSFKGILFGFVLFLIAFPLLFWNEGRAVKQAQAITEGRGAVVSVSSDKVDPANQGKLVHMSGRATAEGLLQDDEFGVSADGAIRLRRSVEMYQWKQDSKSEKRKKLGGGEETVTTYTYQKVWSDEPIDSSSFKESGHTNPGEFPVQESEQNAQVVHVGAFTLGDTLTSQIDSWNEMAADGKAPSGMVAANGGFYRGKDPAAPQIGDVRVKFQVVEPTQVSLVAVQQGDTFAPYKAKSGNQIMELVVGQKSAAEMFQQMEDSNNLMTWVLRAVGFFLMFLGLTLMMNPLSVLADVVPLFGNLVGFGTGLIAFMLATALSLVTIAIGWIAYRPLLGLSLLALAFVAVVAVVALLRRK